ncbi:MAG: GNAT family N-acetyltransferase [Candidatus Baltobacteraceae bacterium]
MRLIRTQRLRLAPVTAENAGTLWNILQQPDLRMYQDLPTVGAAAFADMVSKRPRHLHPGASGRFEWLVFLEHVRKPVGWVSLRIADRERTVGEIGYSIVRDFRGQGIANESVRAMMDEAFAQAALTRINAYCVAENAASRRVLKRLGFREDGVMTHGATVAGQAVDVLTHRYEREKWLQSGNSIVTPASAYPA